MDTFIFVTILSLSNILVLAIYDKVKGKNAHYHQVKSSLAHVFLDISKLILSVILGVIVGAICVYYNYTVDYNFIDIASNVALLILIFIVGLQLGSAKYRLKDVLLNKEAIIISLLFTFSCLLGGVIISFFVNMDLPKVLALSSGMGWYSLTSVIITNAYGALDGSLVFFVDIARELLALILVPILMKNFRCTAITFPGATSLDCSLPIIQKSGGTGVVGLAISFGFLANLYVPILLILFTSI
ncbi:lysine exporter LysO family protein [Psittacicella gerlachiana]|uniref:lysine exporter LysO family protein n=1 Tax=Psittacicella gerlachiana TaxID=2028574 RepID=UPI001CA6A420|nr:LysO family transporter [Psittacicella gerlachiana]